MGVKEKLADASRGLSSKVSSSASSFVFRVEEKVTKPSTSTRTAQILATVLLPCVVPVYMGVSAGIYLAMTGVLTSIGLGGAAFTGFIDFFIGFGLVIAGFVIIFKWVQTGGFGYLEV